MQFDLRFDSKILQFDFKKIKLRHYYLLTEFSNTMPNKGHMDVFIYHVLPFQTWKSISVREILEQDISSNSNNIIFSVLGKFCTECSQY